MKYQSRIFFSIFFLKLNLSLACLDSLSSDKSYFLTPLYSGLSFGKNENTYQNGGRYVLGFGVYYHEGRKFSGLEFYKTSFKDIDEPDFKVGQWIKTKATQKVYILSANVGQKFGSKQNISFSGGLGYLQYRYPKVKSFDGLFFSSYYKIIGYDTRNAVCLNSSFKAYWDIDNHPTFLLISGFASSQINFISFSIGYDLHQKKSEYKY